MRPILIESTVHIRHIVVSLYYITTFLYNLLFTVTGPTCIPLFETPSNQVCFDLRSVLKHLQILAVNAWTVHKLYPLVQHILLGGLIIMFGRVASWRIVAGVMVPVAGLLADAFGRRKSMVIITTLIDRKSVV